MSFSKPSPSRCKTNPALDLAKIKAAYYSFPIKGIKEANKLEKELAEAQTLFDATLHGLTLLKERISKGYANAIEIIRYEQALKTREQQLMQPELYVEFTLFPIIIDDTIMDGKIYPALRNEWNAYYYAGSKLEKI